MCCQRIVALARRSDLHHYEPLDVLRVRASATLFLAGWRGNAFLYATLCEAPSFLVCSGVATGE